MPGYVKGTAFTQFTTPQNFPPPLGSDTHGLRKSLCRPDGPNAPFTSAPILTVTFVPELGPETLLLLEPWEDIP
jgi:hypothetical protein